MLTYIHLALSLLASFIRFGAGGAAASVNTQRPLILYEFEGCPFCRVAREAISEAGVTVLVRPCPKAGKRFRPEVREKGGKTQFPYLIDPNADVALYESGEIAGYLRKSYGAKPRPLVHRLGPLNLFSSQLGVVLRLFAGVFVQHSRSPDEPLEFYGAERDPRARLVKEKLCAMEIPYLWRSQPPEGKTAPFLVDPNTHEALSGAHRIRRYLGKTYLQ